MTAAGDRIDAEMIRRTYNAAFDNGAAEFGSPDELAGILREYVRILLPHVISHVARMRGEWRTTGILVIVRAHNLIDEDTPGAEAVHIQDLAGACRGLLSLYELPGPLGDPADEHEIEEALQCRVCGACAQLIKDGEPYKRDAFPTQSSGGTSGYRHMECPALPEDRRLMFRLVPPCSNAPEPA